MPQPSREPGFPLDLRPLGLIALAIALVTSTAIVATTWKSVREKPPQRKIRITGSAKKRIVSDLIEWNASVESHAADRTAAYKQLREGVDKAVELLKKQGIKPEQIQPQSANVKEVFETQYIGVGPSRIEKQISKGFDTSEDIFVRSTDLARIEKASREITSLLEQGVSIASAAPRYYYTRLGELKLEMLAAAGKDARARADNILGSTGGASIGKLLDADMGIININRANSTETSEQGNNDTSSLEKDIITIVHAEFELN
jgi:uncharacterized protein